MQVHLSYSFFLSKSNLCVKLIEKTEHLTPNLATSRFLVVHDPRRSRHDDGTEQTRRQQAPDPLLDVVVRQIISRRDDAALVDSPVQLDDNLTRSVIVDVFELVDVACLFRKDRREGK